MIDAIRALYKNKIFMNFLKRSSFLLGVLFLEIILLVLFVDLGEIKFSLISKGHVLQLIIVFIGLFLVFSGKDLLKIKSLEKLNYKQLALFFSVNLISLFLFYKLSKYLIENLDALQRPGFFGMWLVLSLAIGLSLLFAFFDFKFILYFIKGKSMLISSVITVIWFFFLKYKRYFSVLVLANFLAQIVAKIIYFLLKIFFDGAFYRVDSTSIPTIGIPRFVVKIARPCSGIEGMGLFLLLFTALVLIEHKRINKNKVLLLYTLGIFGAFCINVMRTFSLFVVGHFVSPEFSLGVFHSNVGWIAFTIYFLIFIYFSYPWMKKK